MIVFWRGIILLVSLPGIAYVILGLSEVLFQGGAEFSPATIVALVRTVTLAGGASLLGTLVALILVLRFGLSSPRKMLFLVSFPFLLNAVTLDYALQRLLELVARLFGNPYGLTASGWVIILPLFLYSLPLATFMLLERCIRVRKDHDASHSVLEMAGGDRRMEAEYLLSYDISRLVLPAWMLCFSLTFPFFFASRYFGNQSVDSLANIVVANYNSAFQVESTENVAFLLLFPIVIGIIVSTLIRKHTPRWLEHAQWSVVLFLTRYLCGRLAPVLLAMVTLLIAAPLVVVALFALSGSATYALPQFSQISLTVIMRALNDDTWRLAMFNSMFLGFSCSLLLFSLWLAGGAIALRTWPKWFKTGLPIVASLPLAVPLVVGVPAVKGVLPQIPNLIVVMIVYVCSLGGLAVMLIIPALELIPETRILAHRSFRGGMWHFLTSVAGASVSMAFISVVVLVSVFIINEPVAPLYVASPDLKLVADALFSGTRSGHKPEAPAVVLLLTVTCCLVGLALTLLERFVRKVLFSTIVLLISVVPLSGQQIILIEGTRGGDIVISDSSVDEVRLRQCMVTGTLEIRVPLTRLEIENCEIDRNFYVKSRVSHLIVRDLILGGVMDIDSPADRLEIEGSKLGWRDTPLVAASFAICREGMISDTYGRGNVLFSVGEGCKADAVTVLTSGLRLSGSLVFENTLGSAFSYSSTADSMTDLTIKKLYDSRVYIRDLHAQDVTLSGTSTSSLAIVGAHLTGNLTIQTEQARAIELTKLSADSVILARSTILRLKGGTWAFQALRLPGSALEELDIPPSDLRGTLCEAAQCVRELLRLEAAAKATGNYDAFLTISHARRRATTNQRMQSGAYMDALLAYVFGMTSGYGISFPRILVSLSLVFAGGAILFRAFGSAWKDSFAEAHRAMLAAELPAHGGLKKLVLASTLILIAYFLLALMIVTLTNILALNATF